jgi:hypothetical protein
MLLTILNTNTKSLPSGELTQVILKANAPPILVAEAMVDRTTIRHHGFSVETDLNVAFIRLLNSVRPEAIHLFPEYAEFVAECNPLTIRDELDGTNPLDGIVKLIHVLDVKLTAVIGGALIKDRVFDLKPDKELTKALTVFSSGKTDIVWPEGKESAIASALLQYTVYYIRHIEPSATLN